MTEYFEVSGFMNDKGQSYDVNTVSRVRNNLVGAIREHKVLPKYIVVVLDSDLIKFAKLKAPKVRDTEAMYTRLMKWIMTQYDRLIASQKDYLPMKVKKNPDHPMVIWIEPPCHDSFRDNKFRKEFGLVLANNVQYHENHFSVKLIKAWNEDDSTLFDPQDRKFTAQGYITYWEAIDKAVKYVDTILVKKEAQKKKKAKAAKFTSKKIKGGTPKQRFFNDKFHWSRKSNHHARH